MAASGVPAAACVCVCVSCGETGGRGGWVVGQEDREVFWARPRRTTWRRFAAQASVVLVLALAVTMTVPRHAQVPDLKNSITAGPDKKSIMSKRKDAVDWMAVRGVTVCRDARGV